MSEAYCVRCKSRVEMRSARKVTTRNGRPALKDACPRCGSIVYKMGRS